MAFYASNSDLVKEMIISKERNELTPNAIKIFQRMIKEIIKPMRYKEPMDREDCMAEAMSDILKYWRSFNPEYENANAFAYFTQTIKKGFAKGWRRLHKIKTIKMVYIDAEAGSYNI